MIHQLYQQTQLRVGDYAYIQLACSNDDSNDDDYEEIDRHHHGHQQQQQQNRTRKKRRLIVQLHAMELLLHQYHDISNGSTATTTNTTTNTHHDCFYMDSLLAINLGYNIYHHSNCGSTNSLLLGDIHHPTDVQAQISFHLAEVGHVNVTSIPKTPIPIAHDVTLYFIGRRPILYRSNDNQNHSCYNTNNFHNSFTGNDTVKKTPVLPTIGSIIQSNTLIHQCGGSFQNNVNDSHDDIWEYLYEVGTIIHRASTTTNMEQQQVSLTEYGCYQTTNETTFHVYERQSSPAILASSSPSLWMVPMLPPMLCRANMTNATVLEERLHGINDDIEKISPTQLQPLLWSQCPYNENVHMLLQQWKGLFMDTFINHTNAPILTPEQCIYHIVGTNVDHDAVHIIENVAQQLGRQCIHVSGFAAAAHLYNGTAETNDHTVNTTKPTQSLDTDSGDKNNFGKNRDADDNYTVTTGGWIDKLRGLKCAVQDAVLSHIPTILILSEVDEEFTSTNNNDASIRHLEESRIWALLTDTLSSFPHQPDEDDCDDGVASRFGIPTLPLYTPSVIVVLLTATPLSNGPLLQNILYDSMTLQLPDASYIEYIWTQQRALSSAPHLDMTNNASTHPLISYGTGNNFDRDQILSVVNRVPIATLQHFMRGRSVQEIFDIRDDFILAALTTMKNAEHPTVVDDSSVLTHLFENTCIEKDKARRCKSSMAGRISAVHWTDVGGLDHVRDEIRNTIELPLQYPQLFASPHGHRRHRPSGILLYGPPGTGKTFVAKAVATEYGLPFLSVKGPELLGSYVGESEAQVRAIFNQARQLAQENKNSKACILFFDELDSLAPRRGDHSGSGGNVMDRVVASMLIELDKDPVTDAIVFCIGATNRPDMLDPSLLRPGRFDRLVYLGVSASDRVSILTTHLTKLRLVGDAHEIAEKVVPHLPSNVTAADISTIASGALMRAIERLCDEADRELAERRQQLSSNCVNSCVENIAINDILASWDKNQLEPVVTYNDLLEVAAQIVPSVNEAELKKYEELHDQYKMAVSSNKN